MNQIDKQELVCALQAMGLPHGDAQIAKLEQFIALLIKWNKVYNLTAIRDARQMVTHHLLDSLAIVPYVEGKRVLDVGSGAGFPGIPLAVFKPEASFTLLDSNRKKTRFIAQAAIELGLKNIEVVTSRVEVCEFDKPFDTIVTRAFASVDKILALTCSHCAEGGQLLLMKGVVPEQELKQLPKPFALKRVIPLEIPNLEGQRHLIVLEKC